MPVSYNLKDKTVSLDNNIEYQSLEVVRKMLEAGEIIELRLSNIDIILLPLLNLRHVKKLSISNLPCYDFGFLASVIELESLRLSFDISMAKKIRLETVPRMKTLTSLSLSNFRGLASLPEFPNLRELNLMSVTNDNFDFLDLYPRITDIFISGGYLEKYNRLLHCRHLERLRIIQSRKIDFAGMIADATINHSLKILEISHCPSLTDFAFLKLFAELKYMDITSCKNISSYEGIENCKKLKVINISECKVRDKTLKYLEGIKKIFLGISYRKDEVELFKNEFKGNVYSIGKFDKGKFDYPDHFTRYFSKSLDTLQKI